MLINGSSDTGTYSEIFSSVLRYFLQVIFEVTYVGLVYYGFVTLRRNYSHLILEHAIYQFLIHHLHLMYLGGKLHKIIHNYMTISLNKLFVVTSLRTSMAEFLSYP